MTTGGSTLTVRPGGPIPTVVARGIGNTLGITTAPSVAHGTGGTTKSGSNAGRTNDGRDRGRAAWGRQLSTTPAH